MVDVRRGVVETPFGVHAALFFAAYTQDGAGSAYDMSGFKVGMDPHLTIGRRELAFTNFSRERVAVSW